MSVKAELSDTSSRHRFGRRSALKKFAISHSDFDEPDEKKHQNHNSQRSASVCAGSDVPPRMAQLETLEAKMANIEVSLSMTPRRRKSSSINLRTPLAQMLQAPMIQQGLQTKEAADPLRVNIKDKENRIQNLKEQISSTLNMTRGTRHYNGNEPGCEEPPLTDSERRLTEDKLANLRSEMEAKRTSIKGLKASLERLDITDNIDIRIQQAELEYQLGREELELLTLMEQSRAFQLLLEQDDSMKTKQDQQTIYSCIDGGAMVTLHAVQVEYDPKSPQFGAGMRTRQCGLWVEWALEHTGMCKGDRLLEVNGKLVLTKNKEDMTRLLSISPNPAQLVVLRTRPLEGGDQNGTRIFAQTALSQVGSLRAELNSLRDQAEEAQRTKDGLRSDNLRLTHRITYLEEQVAELLDRNKDHDSEVQIVIPHKFVTSTVNTQKNVTNINITSEPSPKSSQPKSDVQVFQKGPDVTAIVANIPGLEIGGKDTAEASANLPIIRPKSNASNVSSTQISIGHSPKSNCSKSSCSVDFNDLPKPTHYPTNHVHFNHKTNKIFSKYSLQPSKSSNSLDHGECSDKDLKPHSIRQSSSHQSIHKSKDYKKLDYNSETSAAIEIIKKNQRQYFDKYNKTSKNNLYSKAVSDDNNSDIQKCYKREHKRSSSILEYFEKGINGHKKSSKRNSQESEQSDAAERIKGNEEEITNPKSSILVKRLSKYSDSEGFDYHPDRDYIDHRIDGKIIQNAHKSSRRLSKLHSKKPVECDSEPSQTLAEEKYRKCRMKILDYTSEPNSIQGHYKKHYQNSDRPRPTPPKKPLRLSLHRAQSMQSVEATKPSNETFYLHDPMQRQSSVNDVASKNETNFSIINSSSTSKINSLFYGNHEDFTIKPDNPYRNEGNQLSVKFSLDEEHKKASQEPTIEKKIKKRSHNGKLTYSSGANNIQNGHENDRNIGYLSSRSESLASIPKTPNGKIYSHHHNGYTSDGLRLSTCNDRSKAELQIKSNRNSNDAPKMNGLSSCEKHESTSESSRTTSKTESCHSGFRWPSSTVFRNIRIESPIKTNGHMSDCSRK